MKANWTALVLALAQDWSELEVTFTPDVWGKKTLKFIVEKE